MATEIKPEKPEGPTSTGKQLAVLLAILALGAVAIAIAQGVIRAAGWVTPVSNFLTVLFGALAAAAAAIEAQRKFLSEALPTWLTVAFVIVLLSVIASAWLFRGETSVFKDKLTVSQPTWEHVLKAESGDRVVVVLETSGGLAAELRLDRGRWRHDGMTAPDGTKIVDETLHGGQWRIRVAATEGTTGDFEVRVEKDPGRPVAVGDSLESEALTGAADSNGYRFLLLTGQSVYVAVEPESDLTLQLALRREGWEVANPRFTNGRWEVLRHLEAGEYMIVIHSPEQQRGDYALHVLSEAPASTPTETTLPPEVRLDVPLGLVGTSQELAEEQLLNVGFSYAVWNICSGSVPEGVVRQVVREDAEEGEVVIQDLDGPVPTETRLAAGTKLILKVGTGEACATDG